MNIKEYVEMAVEDLVEARSYVSTNSIPVARASDRDVVRGNMHVNIDSNALTRLSNNHDRYSLIISIQAVSKMEHDLDGDKLDDLSADISDFIYEDMTISALQTAINSVSITSGIAIQGIDFPSTENQIQETFSYQEYSAIIYLTYTT
jgi:hypothetical protein